MREIDFTFFEGVCKEIIDNPNYLSMKKYLSHGNVNCFDHCINVAKSSYVYAIKNEITCDLKSLIRGALLHDYYLYDWHVSKGRKKLHGFRHPKIALTNALKDFSLNEKERNIIKTHMFPLTFFLIPKCKEAWIVSKCDKKCASQEMKSKKTVFN